MSEPLRIGDAFSQGLHKKVTAATPQNADAVRNDKTAGTGPHKKGADGRSARFELFVRLHKAAKVRFVKQQETHSFRGDRYDANAPPSKQLRMLLNQLKSYWRQYMVAELYDNNYPKGSNERLVYRYKAGTVEVNELHRYRELLANYPPLKIGVQ